MKILALVAGFVVSIAIVIVGIGASLSPDGMKACRQKPSTETGCQSVDAIVAVSGGDTTARTAQAITMYKNGWAGLLVFSGAAADKEGPSNAETMKRQAIEAGVPAADILVDETSETTKQNAVNTAMLFQQNNIHSVILVTSAYHQRRAGLEFGALAGNNVMIINHPVVSDDQWSSWWWTTPTGWFLAISELFKIAAFYAGGSR
jgi:uncharacterized SAM-binding protein YcdF (DUF218 family)